MDLEEEEEEEGEEDEEEEEYEDEEDEEEEEEEVEEDIEFVEDMEYGDDSVLVGATAATTRSVADDDGIITAQKTPHRYRGQLRMNVATVKWFGPFLQELGYYQDNFSASLSVQLAWAGQRFATDRVSLDSIVVWNADFNIALANNGNWMDLEELEDMWLEVHIEDSESGETWYCCYCYVDLPSALRCSARSGGGAAAAAAGKTKRRKGEEGEEGVTYARIYGADDEEIGRVAFELDLATVSAQS
eukprot:GHVU01086577.1.p1 GENE.GHVU01086577.1~~GHVU01086577.1.p1  ORF type:complete len:245 (+),score=73.69 GHVU01086577.1:684-1418(+)